MTDTRHISRGAAYLVGGELLFQLFGFLRNILVARAIEPEEFGVASAIAISVSFIEVLGGLEIGRFLTRKHGADQRAWLAISHSITMFRGFLTAFLIVIFSGVIANFMALPQFAWAFAMMAVVPIMRAFTNNSHWMEQKNLNFRPFVICQAVPQIVSLCLTLPILYQFPDFRALLFLSMINAAVFVILTHLVRTQNYELKLNRLKFAELWRYSFPLWVDGLLMFWVLQGERVIVSREFGPEWLGVYSAAFMLTWTPAAIASRFSQSIGVPYFSKQLHAGVDYKDGEYTMVTIVVALAIGFSWSVSLAGGVILTWLFGASYAVPFLLMGLLGLHYALRILRASPTVLFLAVGETKHIAQANLIRGSGVIFAWIGAVLTDSIYSIFIVSVIAEFLACEWLFFRCRKFSDISLGYRYIVYIICVIPIALLVEFQTTLQEWAINDISYVLIVGCIATMLSMLIILKSVVQNKSFRSNTLQIIKKISGNKI